MPLPPYAKLRASVNGASVVTGGITCSGGESIVLSADPAGALSSFLFQIYDKPPEFACPAGWSTDSNDVYFFQSTSGTAPAFTLGSAAQWWKYMFRLTGNNGDNGGNRNIPASQLIDESTAITIASPSGLQQIGSNETNQFNPNWNTTLQKNLRVVDAIANSSATSSVKSPAALVDTSNVASLAGEQTIDGTLTSATRVLLVGQTTSSQNGLWITGSTWTRPTDFNADAQVVAGQTVYVTGGTLGTGTTWRLLSGSTIAGAKSYGQVLNGKGLAPVRAVQLNALPAYTYSGGVITATANGPLASTYFDGIAPLSTDNVRDYLVVLEGTNNGIYTCTTTGDGSHPWVLTRRSDLNTTASFVGGVSAGVLGGTQGNAWQLTTLGVVTLDTTATSWAAAREKDRKEVDLSKAPYFVKGYFNDSLGTQWAADGSIDYGAIITQAFANEPSGSRLRLPAGQIYCSSPINTQPTMSLAGAAGILATTLSPANLAAGFLLQGMPITQPTPSATVVDSAAGSLALPLKNSAANFIISITPLLWFNAQPAFTLRYRFELQSLPTSGETFGHMVSCRGRRLISDPLDTLFDLFLHETGYVRASLRTYDATAGAYGAITSTGGGTSAITGDATIKPNQDLPFALKWITSGTIGTAGITYQVSDDGGVTWSQTYALGTATSLSAVPTTPVLVPWNPTFVAKFNFGAGTVVAGGGFTCTTSGTTQTTVLQTAAGSAVPGTTYDLSLCYDSTVVGNNVNLYLSVSGHSPPATPITGTATGVLTQKPWEECIFGSARNNVFPQSYEEYATADVLFGSCMFSNQWVLPARAGGTVAAGASIGHADPYVATTVPTTITQGSTGEQLYFRPNTTDALYMPDGTTIRSYKCAYQGFATSRPYYGNIQVNRAYTFQHDCLFEDFTILGNNATNVSGIQINCPVGCRFKDITIGNVGIGWFTPGPVFFTDVESLRINAVFVGFSATNGGILFGGQSILDGGKLIYATSNTGHQGNCFINTEVGTLCAMSIDQVLYTSDITVACDDENQGGSTTIGRELVRIGVCNGMSFTLRGNVGSGETPTIPITRGAANGVPGTTTGVIHLDALSLVSGSDTPCLVSLLDTAGATIECGAAFAPRGLNYTAFTGSRLANRKGFMHRYGTEAAPGTALADTAGATISLSAGKRRVLGAGTLTANRAATLDPTGALEGDEFSLAILAQGYTYAIANGGSAGGTLFTAPVGYIGTVQARFDGTDYVLTKV